MAHLTKLCGITQKFTSGYHPQTNGLTERFNRTIQELLSKFVNPQQTNWDELLPATVFAYNRSIHSSTGYTPFEMIHGYIPKDPIETQLVKTKPQLAASEWVKSIHDRARLQQETGLSRQVRRAATQAKQHDKGKKLKSIKIGDLVRVDMSQRINPQIKKLSRMWKGPYTVIRKCGPVSFRVMDPDGFELNDAVHIDRLMKINDERQS